MILNKLCIFILFSLFLNGISSNASSRDSTTISGKSLEYAGVRITIEYQSNIITRERSQLLSFVVKPDGTFKSSFILANTTRLYLSLGKTEGLIILQPKGNYEIALPPYVALEDADKMNPFFTPDPVPLAIIKGDQDNLNRNIALFDDEFNDVYVTNIHKLFKKENEAPIKTIIQRFDSVYPSTNEWFVQYKHFTYHKLYDLTFQRRKEYVIDKFFKNAPFLPSNNAYIEAFNATFYRYFALKFNSTTSDVLKKAWTSRSIDSISLALKNSTMLVEDKLREAVILKNLYDAYYSNLYNKNEILMLVAQAETHFTTSINKAWAITILTEIKQLQVGTPAPNFELQSLNDKSINLRKYKGKFVYLNFVHTLNFACKKDLLALVAIQNITKKDLQIVSIVTDKDIIKAKAFVKTNKLDWDFLNVHSQESMLTDYKIKALPTYFLIDPEGKLILSPAPGPEENFLGTFQEQAKAYRNKELRKNPPKDKSIFDL